MYPIRCIFVPMIFATLIGCTNKCDVLAHSSTLNYNMTFHVRAKDTPRFNAKLTSYLEKESFLYQVTVNKEYLSPPDTIGKQFRFNNIQTIGCTNRTLIWSENVIHPQEFIVTIDKTIFGDANTSEKHARDLQFILADFVEKPIKVTNYGAGELKLR